jgi:hypothetical protein
LPSSYLAGPNVCALGQHAQKILSFKNFSSL